MVYYLILKDCFFDKYVSELVQYINQFVFKSEMTLKKKMKLKLKIYINSIDVKNLKMKTYY